jgi:hypothetical protein
LAYAEKVNDTSIHAALSDFESEKCDENGKKY